MTFGTVYKLSKDGTNYRVLHNFAGGMDGKNPQAALIKSKDGALYGTTVFSDSATRGTLFRLDQNGSNYIVLHNFTGAPDGQSIQGKLVQDSDGALYGATGFGGNYGAGTVFKLNTDGTGYLVLLSFTGRNGDSAFPSAGLIEGSDGVFYGTTQYGGAADAGCVFAFTTAAIRPRVKALSVSSNSIIVQFSGTSGIQSEVQRSTDLVSWTVLGTPTASIDGSFSFTDFSPPQYGFYRLKQY